MTNASRRLDTHRRAQNTGLVASLAQRSSTFIFIAALILALLVFHMGPVTALSNAVPESWLIERVDIGRLSKTDLRSLQAPSLVVDANQQPHIIYSEYFEEGPPSILNYATKTAGAWVTRTVELNGGASPALALTSQGQLRASFLDIFVADNTVRYGQSVDGMLWATQPVTSGFNSRQSSSDLALDGSDQAAIVFGSQENISSQIYRMSLARQSGNIWAVQPIGDGNGIAPTVAVDTLGQVHVSYLSVLSSTRRVVSYAVLSNSVWLTETVGDFDDTPVVVPSRIAVDATNTPHIAYTNSSRNELVYASRTNGLWTREIVTGNVDALDLVLDSTGLPHMAYIEPTLPHRLIYATQTGPNGPWISSTVNTNSPDDPLPPISIALGPTGLPYIAYIDFTTGDLHLARIGQAIYMPVVLH